MGDPNAPQLDPITGLPSYMLDTGTIQQILLNSQPLIAPEWLPQGRVQSVYWPDNAPSFLGTLQAYNNAAPQTVQALSTDGKRNLNVNIAGGGGGGGGTPSTIIPYKVGETTSGFGTEKIIELGVIGSTIWGFTWSWGLDLGGSALTAVNGQVKLYIPGGTSDDFTMSTFPVTASPVNHYFYLNGYDTVIYPNGFVFATAEDFGTGNYQVWLESTNVGGGELNIGVWCSA